MKLYTNKKYHTIAVYAAVVIAVNVLLVVAVFNISKIIDGIMVLLKVMNPVIWGLVIAFLINPIMVKTENFLKDKVFKSRDENGEPKRAGAIKAISVGVTTLVFLGIVVGLVALVVPELIKSITDIFNNAQSIVSTVQNWINKVFKNYPYIETYATNMLSDFNTGFSEVMTKLQPVFDNILSGAWGFVNFVKNFLLGFIVSVYLLCNKEKLLAQSKKIIISMTKKKTCERIMDVAAKANTVFSGFITGKIVDSIIIGLICFIGLTFMSMPYNIMISVLIGVTNIIPFFGPFIGAIPSAILILLIEPKKVILFAIFIFVLQQFDGNILGPKILGDSTGLPGFWVLISLLIFGGLFGFVGMVLAVPAFALIYSFVRDGVNNKLRKKHLPVDTDYYKKDVAHLYAKPPERKPLTAEQLLQLDIPSIDEVNEVEMEKGGS
ncbi:MAG: AI-2E family transporter [Ruminococcus sp.]|nr:AI-2E family transporter [Ruminococcus sp.]